MHSKMIRVKLQGGGCTGESLVRCFGTGIRDWFPNCSRVDNKIVKLEKKIKQL